MSSPTTVVDPERLKKHAAELAHVASLLAHEASAITRIHCGEGQETDVATRAAAQAEEAASLLTELTRRGAGPDETVSAAIWALTSAAVALTQAKLGTPLAPKWGE